MTLTPLILRTSTTFQVNSESFPRLCRVSNLKPKSNAQTRKTTISLTCTKPHKPTTRCLGLDLIKHPLPKATIVTADNCQNEMTSRYSTTSRSHHYCSRIMIRFIRRSFPASTRSSNNSVLQRITTKSAERNSFV